MGEKQITPFQASDAWLLLAILYNGEQGAGIEGIIRAGDFINHAIFTDDELQSGLTRLQEAGLVERSGDIYRASPAAWSAHVSKKRRYVFKELEDMERFLNDDWITRE